MKRLRLNSNFSKEMHVRLLNPTGLIPFCYVMVSLIITFFNVPVRLKVCMKVKKTIKIKSAIFDKQKLVFTRLPVEKPVFSLIYFQKNIGTT